MSQAEALLNSLSSNETTVYSRNSETEGHIVIGNDRRITVPDSLKRIAVQYDHNVETVTFDCPRYWDNHDMSQMKVYINYLLPDNRIGYYPAENITPVGNTMTFTWTIKNEITQVKGNISILVCVKSTDANGYESAHWNSELNSDMYISEGLEATNQIINQYPDIVTFLLTRMDEVEAIATVEAMQSYTNEWLEANHARVLAEIEAKGLETLATIPADYSETYNLAHDSVRTRANAIVCETSSETIVVNDSSNDYIRGLKMFGKTTQAASPTPDNPQELVTVGSDGSVDVEIFGKNLVNIHRADIGKTNSTVSVDGNAIVVKTAVDNNFAIANIPVTYPTNTPLAISFDATILQGCDFMPSQAMPVYMRKGSSTSPHVNLAITSDKRSYTITIPNGLPEAGYSLWLYIKTAADLVGTVEVKYENIQIEIGSVATTYEAYVEAQSMPVEVSGGLPGIPVTSGGNYTDANGQQWICDEIDFGRGVYVKRINTITFTGDEGWYVSAAQIDAGTRFDCNISTAPPALITDSLCNRFSYTGVNAHVETAWILENSYGFRIITEQANTAEELKTFLAANPTTMMYVMYTPIETSLTETELAAFTKLHSNYPTTTVLNDSGAWVKMEYNADTRTYIENLPGASEEDVTNAVNDYLTKNPVSLDPVVLTDTVTGVKYRLYVVNGKLAMSEV